MESCSVIGLVQRRSDLVKIYGDAAIVTGYSVGTVAETGMPGIRTPIPRPSSHSSKNGSLNTASSTHAAG